MFKVKRVRVYQLSWVFINFPGGVKSAIFALLSENDEVALQLGCIYFLLFAVPTNRR